MERMIIRRFSLILLAATCMLMVGCATPIVIRSLPEGARIMDNGKDTGLVTPGEIPVGDLPVGRHQITVEKEGYRSVTQPQPFRVKVSTRAIISTVILAPIYLPANFAGDWWKDAEGLRFSWNLPGYELPVFLLRKIE